MEDRILTTQQAADLLQVTYETARRWLKTGRIPGRQINGKVWRVVESDLKDFIRGVHIEEPRDTTEHGEVSA